MSMKLKWFKKVLCSCFIMLALLVVSSASEGAIHVTVAGAGNKSGDSWANAMDVVGFRAALEAGIEGEYWVAEGTYTPDDADPVKSFVLKNNIALYGGFAGDETKREERDCETNVTTLSGAIGGLHSNNVVRATGVNSTAILDGFTITGGEATGGDFGGGMLISAGSPTVANCVFLENKANEYGGGMYILNGSATVMNCTFLENEANQYGGGMYLDRANPKVSNCTFSGNKANKNGGGMFIIFGNPTLTNCTFSGNEAKQYGGGMAIEYGSTTLTNCTFSGNLANTSGGGMYIEEGNPTLTNCTFSGNGANQYGGGMYITDISNLTLTNTIFWGASSATGQVIMEPGGTLTITYSVVDTGVFPGEGNTKADPKLGPLADNGGPTQTCALLEGSSAIDSGTDTGAPSTDQRGVSRPQGLGYDIGAYEKEEAPVPPKPGSSGGGGCAAGPFSPWVLALLAPLAPIALRKRPGITIRARRPVL